MQQATDLVRRLGIRHPIVQAPMAGGASTVELVASVCEAGALGFLGCAYSSPEAIREMAAAVRARTRRPFGVNLFAPLPPPAATVDFSRALSALANAHAELGLAPPSAPSATGIPFEGQLEAILATGASTFSFTFGLLPPDVITEVKNHGMLVAGTATTVHEALAMEASGVDAIVAQGSEAGAHRGTFAASFEESMIGTIALVPQIVDRVGIPVIASGGIMDGRGVAAALALGADAAQLGTAFLTCTEAGIPDAHKRAILDAAEHQTRVTRAFSGRPARGIVNRLMDDLERDPGAILPFPLQNALTRTVRTAAAEQDRAEYLSLWAGQGISLARRLPAAELVERIAAETDQAIERTAAAAPPPAALGLPERHAAVARLQVEHGLDRCRARADNDALRHGQVRPAHQRTVAIGQGVEGAVAKADRAERVGDRLVSTALERPEQPGAAGPASRSAAKLAAKVVRGLAQHRWWATAAQPLEGGGEEARGIAIATLRNGDAELAVGAPVDPRRPSRARADPPAQAAIRGIQQPRVDELVEVEGRQPTRHADGLRSLLAPDRLQLGYDPLVQAAADRLVEHPERGEVLVACLLRHGWDSIT
jgi:nitronate monooxygenase